MPKDTQSQYPCHSSKIPKLNRASGQLEGVKRMIEEGRYCPDILTQLRAARAALKSLEADILETHLQSCVTEAMKHGSKETQDQKIEEIKNLFKRFE
jgi:DNA-binding FrmR family transcriptional regulator